MKGGITSGVVYPPAILRLQREFRFRSVGGTSAGAIAAALTAAAELGRETGGFRRLDEKRQELSQPNGLRTLFTPQEQARPLLETAIAVADRSGKGGYLGRAYRALGRFLPTAVRKGRLYGAVIGLASVLLLLAPAAVYLIWRGAGGETGQRIAEAAGVTGLLGIVCGALLGGVIAPVIRLIKIALQLPRDGYFGLCAGYEGENRKEVLTTWLADAIDQVAGRDLAGDPLTFAELRAKTVEGGAGGRDAGITLRMVTSNLSHREPYLLPFDERKLFLFNERDMRRFFPSRVVSYLVREAATTKLPLPEGYHFLPEGDKLPVIVAARLSLSFPFLLCAVPLYTIRLNAFAEMDQPEPSGALFVFDPARHFQKNWFSDGGISSNFPIHFFDAWSPQRPTFGVNLMDVPEGAKVDGKVRAEQFAASAVEDEDGSTQAQDVEDVYLPHPNETRIWPQWNPVESFPAFIMGIFNTARNYRDNKQTRLPSYRERIVQIRLQPHEGGLNLTMTQETIQGIEDKGYRAGAELQGMDFDQHRWVRLLVLMAELEKGLFELGAAFSGPEAFSQLFAAAAERRWYRSGYWKEKGRSKLAVERLAKLLEFLSTWGGTHPALFRENPPKPESTLRVTPPI